MNYQITNQPRTARVVHSVPRSWLPMTQNWLYNQVHHLPEQVESHVVCRERENTDKFPTSNVHTIADQPVRTHVCDTLLKRLCIRRHSSLLEQVIKLVQPDILHSHFGNVACDNAALARRIGVKHVVTFYGLDVNYLPRQRAWMRRYQQMFRDIDLVLCEGPHMASCIVELGCPAAKVQVQRLGVNLDNIDFAPRQRRSDEPLRILLAAEFREKKGLPDALEAIGRFRAATNTPIEITLIGDAGRSAANQAEKQRIVDTIARHRLDDAVHMLGRQSYDRLMAEAATHHVFIHPSVTAFDGQTEGGAPVALLDMAAAGLPIIGTRHCDIPEIVIPGVTGLLAEERDPDGLAELLTQFVSKPFACAAMAAKARAHVEQYFDARTQGKVLADRYHRLLGLIELSGSNFGDSQLQRIAA